MHVFWTVLTLILVIGSFFGMLIAFSNRPQHFMHTCIGVGVAWVGYGIMLYLLSSVMVLP